MRHMHAIPGMVALVLLATGAAGRAHAMPPVRAAQQSFSYVVDASVLPDRQGTGVDVQAGQTVTIASADGSWSCSPSYSAVGPEGHRKSVPGTLTLRSARLCALIGRVGRGPWQVVSKARSLTATSDGELFLAANDIASNRGAYADNSGALEVAFDVE